MLPVVICARTMLTQPMIPRTRNVRIIYSFGASYACAARKINGNLNSRGARAHACRVDTHVDTRSWSTGETWKWIPIADCLPAEATFTFEPYASPETASSLDPHPPAG